MTTFDRTTRLEFDSSDPDCLRIELPEEWSSLVGAHGGYVTALAVRAAESRCGAQVVRTVHTTFLRPIIIGPAELSITSPRAGRSLSTFDVTLRQNDRPVSLTRVTCAAGAGTEWDHASPLPVPGVEACITVPGPPGIRHLDHAVSLLDPAHLPLSRSDLAVLRGHIRPAETRPEIGRAHV